MTEQTDHQFDRRLLLAGGVGLSLLPIVSAAAEPGRTEAQMQKDWPWLGRYVAANRAVAASGVAVEIVFMGDSITEGWVKAPSNFFKIGWIGRGIGGQTTPQMALRMMADVAALRPRIVHILGGTNDVAENTGPITPEETVANIHMMVSIARASGIVVLLGAIPPAAEFWWRRGLGPAARIEALNPMLKNLARKTRSYWIDYHHVLSDGKGGMNPLYSDDGVHPNAVGYATMENAAKPVIAYAKKGGRRHEI